MDNGCNLNKDCSAAGLTAQTPEKYNACNVKQQAPEAVEGCKYCFYASQNPRVTRIQMLMTRLNRAQGYAYG